jgi:hypothetical protein
VAIRPVGLQEPSSLDEMACWRELEETVELAGTSVQPDMNASRSRVRNGELLDRVCSMVSPGE